MCRSQTKHSDPNLLFLSCLIIAGEFESPGPQLILIPIYGGIYGQTRDLTFTIKLEENWFKSFCKIQKLEYLVS